MTIYQSLGPSYAPEEVVRWTILQMQVVVADIIMVIPLAEVYVTARDH